MGIETTIAIGIAVASAATSVASTVAANKQSKDIAEYQNRQRAAAFAKSAAVQREQAVIAGAEKRRALHDRYDALKGATKAAAAERNVADARSTSASIGALGIQTARESAKISLEQALGTQSYEISNQPMWQVAQTGSAFLSGIQGGLQGLSLGLSVADSMQSAKAAQAQLQKPIG